MYKILTINLLLYLCIACDDNNITSRIPYVPFQFTLDLAGADNSLTGTLSFKEYTAARIGTDTRRIGYGGLLVVNGIGSDGSIINLYAYDLACPNEVQPNIKIKPESSGITAKCPECGAEYNIAYGNGNPVSKSGAKYPLQRYNVVREQGSETRFRVVN